MNPRDPVSALRPFIKIGDSKILQPMLAKVDLLKYGGDLLTVACQEGKRDIVEFFISKGADITSPPETIVGDDQYRKTPFVISAAQSGNWDTLQGVCQSGGVLSEKGFICFSKKRKNQVISNVLGCAAWNGKNLVLKRVLPTLKPTLEMQVVEQLDNKSKAPGGFQKEFTGYTPLLLAVARDDENLEVVKTLLQHGADFEARDFAGNGVIHIAAMNNNTKILDYLTKNLKTDMFSRNKNGETALSLANADGAKILEQYQKEYDQSGSTAQDLLDELTKEQEQDEEAKAKRKLKKWRNKVNKIAKTENISVEEVEKRLQQQE
jgi:ankyrin repeat protein